MTIEQANQYFAALPDGFASTEQLHAAFTAPVQKVQFVGVAGTAGKTVVARLLAAINAAVEELRADGTLSELSLRYFGSDISSET